jgi:nitrite reductase/ring-hydroxylating ferredoxin subunit
MEQLSTQERFKRGAADAPRYFQFMADFIGFTPDDAASIRETRFIIEKHIPRIVADFYSQLLRYPATRRFFLHKDGRLNQPYLEMRMQHQAGFWRRTAAGVYDEDYIRFVDYVGRAHTSHGADPKIYIPERYVMGMVGFVQDRIGRALTAELHELDPELEVRGIKAWNRLLMVLLEVLARPYGQGREEETFEVSEGVDDQAMHDLAIETYERALGIARCIERREVHVGAAADIPPGDRRIVQADDLSVGVFHHTDGNWYALHNSCLHRGGPVCAGTLEGDTLTCPWHGYQYDVRTGQLLLDRHATLPKYEVEVRDGQVYVHLLTLIRDTEPVTLEMPDLPAPAPEPPAPLRENEVRAADLPPGQARRVTVAGEAVAVYNVEGAFYATHDECTHAGGPLSEGDLKGAQIVCPWHASCFNVTTGAVECGPAQEPVLIYRVVTEGGVVRVEAP